MPPFNTSTQTDKKWILLACLSLVILIAIAYQDAPKNGFHLDDYDNIVRHSPLWLDELSIEGLLKAGQEAFLPNRPLPSITFAIDWWQGGGEPAPFQWTNLILHSITALILLGLLNTLLNLFLGSLGRRNLWCAFLGAAFWALHPIQIQGVTYIVQRMASMATLFTLLAVWSYIRWRLFPNRKLLWLLFCITASFCGALSKENAWIIPALLLLVEYGVCRHSKPLIVSRWDYLWLSLPIILSIYVITDLISGVGPVSNYVLPGYSKRDFTLAERLLTQPRVILFHFSQVLWPLPGRFSIEHSFPLSTGLLQPASTLTTILALLAWIAAGIRLLLLQDYRLWGFLLLWVPTTLAIESSIIPLEMVFEHRMYMPMAGLAGMVALGLGISSKRGRGIFLPTSGAAIIIILACLTATLQRVPDWRSRLSLNESALPNAPLSARVQANLALAYIEHGRQDEGIKAAQHALQLDPNQPHAMEALAIVMMDRGEFYKAERYFNHAYNLAGQNSKDSLLNHWGELMVKRSQYQKALAMFSQAIKDFPWIPTYHWNIALTHERLNQCDKARGHWERYLELEPDEGERQIVQEHLREEHIDPSGKCGGSNP